MSVARYTEEWYAKRLQSQKILECLACKKVVPRTGPMQKYCQPCSDARDLERKRLWARANPQVDRPSQWPERKSRTTANGIAISEADRTSIGHVCYRPDLLWLVRVSVPFSYSASKNAIYRLVPRGHVALRKEARAWRDGLRDKLRDAIADVEVVQNKVWLDIMVEKTNHKGDAINLIDSVCDAVKEAIGIDDRWFCIRTLDWRISKSDPRLILGVGQDSREHVQACSSCGRLLSLMCFNKNATMKHGRTRNCNDCRRKGKPDASAA